MTTPYYCKYKLPDSRLIIHINIVPRLTVNNVDSVVTVAINSMNILQQLHYQIKYVIDKGCLQIILNKFDPNKILVRLLNKIQKYLPEP